jgi:glycosyltransferase involved in cell wall biosynthesis
MSWYIPNMGYQENYLPFEQKRLGHEVEIITSDRYPPFHSFDNTVGHILGDRIVGSGIFYDNGIRIHRLPVQLEVPFHGQLFFKGIKNKLRELEPDIVLAHGESELSTIQCIMYQKSLKYKLFLDSHTNYLNLKPYRYYKKLYYRFFKYFFFPFYLKRIKRIFPVTPETKKLLINEFGIPENKIELIPLGVNSERFIYNENKRIEIRKRFGINKEDIVGIYAGKIIPSKEITFLINSSEELLRKYDNFKLMILGSGPKDYADEVKELVIKKGLTGKVIFHDFVRNDELPTFYSMADIGIWPGNSSNTMIEAMSCSLPIILARSEDTVHLLDNNNGFFFEPNNENDFQNYLKKLLENNTLRRKMRKNSKEIVDHFFSSKVLAKKTIEIFEDSL